MVSELLRHLPEQLPAAVFIALHLSPLSREWLSDRLGRASAMKIECPTTELPIERGHVYLARPDHHLIVKEGRVLSVRGPRENLWRPAIDVLFRTAAVAYGPRVIGLLTSGELDDGTAGLQAIKQCGGMAVVQEPADAEHPDMPNVALTNVEIDHRASLHELPNLLRRLIAQEAPAPKEIPQELRKEALMAEAPEEGARITESFGPPSSFSCPECGGPLWTHGPDGTRMRCLVGHAFQLPSLLQGVDAGIDQAIWAAIRMFEQRVNITRMMAEKERASGRDKRADLFDARAHESQAHAQRLRELHRVRDTAYGLTETPSTAANQELEQQRSGQTSLHGSAFEEPQQTQSE
jgi:two-component system, chemotaxis family, protein-glutamate methylesterase/glutaminase